VGSIGPRFRIVIAGHSITTREWHRHRGCPNSLQHEDSRSVVAPKVRPQELRWNRRGRERHCLQRTLTAARSIRKVRGPELMAKNKHEATERRNEME
jgi:hypothetical protein